MYLREGPEFKDCRGDGKEAEPGVFMFLDRERCGCWAVGKRPPPTPAGWPGQKSMFIGAAGAAPARPPRSALPVSSSSPGDRDKVKEEGRGSPAGAGCQEAAG